jgi:hypothetical protein
LVLEDLVGRADVVGGPWIFLATWRASRAREHPRALNCPGLAVGVAGIAPAVPALPVVGIIFGAGGMVRVGGWELPCSPTAQTRGLDTSVRSS